MDFNDRAAAKQKSRDQDQKDLDSGLITREELRLRNGIFALPTGVPNFNKARLF